MLRAGILLISMRCEILACASSDFSDGEGLLGTGSSLFAFQVIFILIPPETCFKFRVVLLKPWRSRMHAYDRARRGCSTPLSHSTDVLDNLGKLIFVRNLGHYAVINESLLRFCVNWNDSILFVLQPRRENNLSSCDVFGCVGVAYTARAFALSLLSKVFKQQWIQEMTTAH